MPWGLRVPIWKINFCSRVLRLSVLPWCMERPQTTICCLEWLGRLKCLANGNGLCTSVHYKPTDSYSYLLYSSSHPSHVKNSIPYSQFLRLRRLCSEDSDFSLKSEEIKCAISLTNVAILLLLFKQAIIAPNKLIGSQHYKRLRRRIIIEFHSPSQPRSRIHHTKKL